MQNIPGIALEKATEQAKAVKFSTANKSEQHDLFANLFNEHAESIDKELAMAPVSSKEQMLDTTPQMADEEPPVNAAGNEAPIIEETPPEPEPEQRDENSRMTQEDLNEVKDDLEAYGMTDEEIAEIEEKVNSEDGMTWGQFVSTIAHKIAQNRSVEMSEDQKAKLTGFFDKFGFTEKESAKLINQLEKGQFSKVMSALKAKVDNMPQDQKLLFDKQEVEAFTSAMGFSKEISSKIKELLGANAMPKEVKQAFTMIRQEMAHMDRKDQELTRAVGKVFAGTMGDKHKQSSAARQVEEAIDLKPRVADENAKVEVKEELAQAVKTTKDGQPDTAVRRNTEKAMTDKVEIKTDTQQEPNAQDAKNESDENWNNLFGKTTDDSQQSKAQAATNADNLSKTSVIDGGTTEKTKAWEKISAPKVMKQVDNAIYKSLNNGTKQLTLQLTPENLGKLSIVLSVQGKEVGATIRAESPEAARLIADNLDIIKNSLEGQGLKVEKLEVQTGLNNNQNNTDWFGQNEHNLSREREAMIAMRNHMKQMRDNSGPGVAQDMQSIREQAINADNGLHVIA